MPVPVSISFGIRSAYADYVQTSGNTKGKGKQKAKPLVAATTRSSTRNIVPSSRLMNNQEANGRKKRRMPTYRNDPEKSQRMLHIYSI